jgi:hypothetical protein
MEEGDEGGGRGDWLFVVEMLLLALLLELLLRMLVVGVENSFRDGGGDEGGE